MSSSHCSIHQASSISIAPEPSIEKEVMEELMVKIEKMDFEKQQLEAEKIELVEKRNSLQKDLVDSQKEFAVVKVRILVVATVVVFAEIFRNERLSF